MVPRYDVPKAAPAPLRLVQEFVNTVDFARRELRPEADGLEGVLGTVLVVAFAAMADGSWGRLKSCRNHTCSWAFYDYSKNRSASWCSMLLCGNRRKTRAYRARRRT